MAEMRRKAAAQLLTRVLRVLNVLPEFLQNWPADRRYDYDRGGNWLAE
jgi:hypothetical protein